MALRKIKSFDDSFKTSHFLEEASISIQSSKVISIYIIINCFLFIILSIVFIINNLLLHYFTCVFFLNVFTFQAVRTFKIIFNLNYRIYIYMYIYIYIYIYPGKNCIYMDIFYI